MSISAPFIRRPIATSLLMLGVLVVRHRRLSASAGRGRARCRFPDHHRDRAISRRRSRDDGLVGRDAARTAIHLDPGAEPDDVVQRRRRHLDHAAVRPDRAASTAQHRTCSRRSTRRAACCHKDLPTPPTYRKVNPADFPILIYAIHSDAVPLYKVDDYANTILAQKLSTGAGVGQVLVFGQQLYAARVQVNPAALAAARHRPRRRAQRAGRARPSTSRRAKSKTSTSRSRSTPTISSSTPRRSAM